MEDLTIAPADMTDQQVFDEVVRRLAAQGAPGYDAESGTCRYETDDGCRCAIGVLLTREHLDAIHAGHDNGTAAAKLPTAIVHWLGATGRSDLFNDLQSAHDAAAEDGYWWRDWRTKMRGVAERYGLDPSALDEPGAA